MATSAPTPPAAPVLSLASDGERLIFLGRVSAALLSSQDYRQTLQALSDLAVPVLGDWCAVDIARPDGGFDRLAVTHSDPSKVELAHEVWRRAPPKADDPAGVPAVVRSGQTELVAEIPAALLADEAGPPEVMALVRSLGLRSYAIIPLIARRRVLGALTLVHAESGRRFAAGDLPAIEEFTRLAALAVDNAALFQALEWALSSEREARARAESSQQELRRFIDNLPELAWTARPDGHIDYYNQRWYAYTGMSFEDMQGWDWEKVHDPALLPLVNERWRRSLATGAPFEMEFTLRGADGLPRWFLTRISPMRGADGSILRWFGANTDINDIKIAQALSQEMAEQSREAERMLLELRGAKERAEARVRELEAGIAGAT